MGVHLHSCPFPPCPAHACCSTGQQFPGWYHEVLREQQLGKKDQKKPDSVCLTCPAHHVQLCIFCPSAQGTFPLIQTLPCIVPCILGIRCQTFDSVFIHAANRKMDYSVSCYLQALLSLPWGKEEDFYSSRQSFLENRKVSSSQKSVRVTGFALQWINSDQTQCCTLQLHWGHLLGI